MRYDKLVMILLRFILFMLTMLLGGVRLLVVFYDLPDSDLGVILIVLRYPGDPQLCHMEVPVTAT